MAGVGGWSSVAPDCVKTGDLGSGFENIAKPYQDCTGFFTFGPGKAYEGAPGEPTAFGGSTAGSKRPESSPAPPGARSSWPMGQASAPAQSAAGNTRTGLNVSAAGPI